MTVELCSTAIKWLLTVCWQPFCQRCHWRWQCCNHINGAWSSRPCREGNEAGRQGQNGTGDGWNRASQRQKEYVLACPICRKHVQFVPVYYAPPHLWPPFSSDLRQLNGWWRSKKTHWQLGVFPVAQLPRDEKKYLPSHPLQCVPFWLGCIIGAGEEGRIGLHS